MHPNSSANRLSSPVLITPDVDGRLVRHEILNVLHNGSNPAEVARVHRDHPDEPESVLNGRVLGTIAPFRCESPSSPPHRSIIPFADGENRLAFFFPSSIALSTGIGDAPFKQPAIFTRRVLYNLYPGIADPTPWETFLTLNRTPPYISSEPDIVHRRLGPRSFLVLATDGLSELYEGPGGRADMVADWARCIAEAGRAPGKENLALRLLRLALGGDDLTSISQMITLDMDTPWMDDTTIIVQAL